VLFTKREGMPACIIITFMSQHTACQSSYKLTTIDGNT